jgi:hypothetical protein
MLGRVLYGLLAILATALAGSPALFGVFSLAKSLLVLILFPSTDFLFRRYQPPAHPLCGAGTLKMPLLPSPHSLHPLPPSQGGRGSG